MNRRCGQRYAQDLRDRLFLASPVGLVRADRATRRCCRNTGDRQSVTVGTPATSFEGRMQADLAKVDSLSLNDAALSCGLARPSRRLLCRSRMDRMTSLSQRLPPHLCRMLGLLLASCRDSGLGSPVLRPLWIEEGMHRAYSLIRLVGARQCQERPESVHDKLADSIDYALAGQLADSFRSLDVAAETTAMPCSIVLRNVVTDLVALFGGDVVVRTDIDHLILPAYKRRALVLATAELTINALLHASPHGAPGRIDVVLKRHGATWSLCVRDDGVGFTRGWPDLQDGVAAGLAALLEGNLACGCSNSGSVGAMEMVFPVPSAAARSALASAPGASQVQRIPLEIATKGA